MRKNSQLVRWTVATALLTATVVGCQNMNNTQRGAGIGAGLGAIFGAIVGHQTGNRDTGAAIGAVVGGTGGALAGHAQDKTEERDAAIEYAHHQDRMRQAERRALSNNEIVQMIQAGVSEVNVIQTINQRGGKFDLSPNAIISLTNAGVPPHIIETMRGNNYTP